MAKKNSSSALIILAIVLLIVAIFGLLWLTVFKKTSVVTISDCKNSECVKAYITAGNFNPLDCAKAPENLRNGCYYAYEIENLKSKKTELGRYCRSIKFDEELGAGCLYEILGQMVMTTNVKENLPGAITSLDIKNCDKISRTEWKELCIKDIGAIKNAIDKKNIDLCFEPVADIYNYNRQRCALMVQDKIMQDSLTKTK